MNEQLQKFIQWLPQNVEEFKGKSADEIAQILNQMSQSEEGQAQLNQLMEQFNSSVSQFRAGGKFASFIKKFSNGGGIVYYAQDGIKYDREAARKQKAGLWSDVTDDFGTYQVRNGGDQNVLAKKMKAMNMTGYSAADFNMDPNQTFDRSEYRKRKELARQANPEWNRRQIKAWALSNRQLGSPSPVIDTSKLNGNWAEDTSEITSAATTQLHNMVTEREAAEQRARLAEEQRVRAAAKAAAEEAAARARVEQGFYNLNSQLSGFTKPTLNIANVNEMADDFVRNYNKHNRAINGPANREWLNKHTINATSNDYIDGEELGLDPNKAYLSYDNYKELVDKTKNDKVFQNKILPHIDWTFKLKYNPKLPWNKIPVIMPSSLDAQLGWFSDWQSYGLGTDAANWFAPFLGGEDVTTKQQLADRAAEMAQKRRDEYVAGSTYMASPDSVRRNTVRPMVQAALEKMQQENQNLTSERDFYRDRWNSLRPKANPGSMSSAPKYTNEANDIMSQFDGNQWSDGFRGRIYSDIANGDFSNFINWPKEVKDAVMAAGLLKNDPRTTPITANKPVSDVRTFLDTYLGTGQPMATRGVVTAPATNAPKSFNQ